MDVTANDSFSPLPASTLPWLDPLLDATTPDAAALAAAGAIGALTGCRNARVLWRLGSGETPACEPLLPFATGTLAQDVLVARQALADGCPRLSSDGRPLLVIPLSRSAGALLLELDDRRDAADVLRLAAEPVHVADRRLRSAEQIAELHGTMARLEHSEQVQRALFAISDLAGSDRDMPELLKGIHAIVGTLMYADNFFIVRLDAQREKMRFLYFVDVVDSAPHGEFSMAERRGSLTWYVLNDGKALRGDDAQLRAQVSGPLRLVGSDSFDWMGVPMLRDGVVEGAIVVQCYEAGIVYSDEDQSVLEFVGSHILTALERKRTQDDLEHDVRQRTLELAEANRGLQQEIIERERGEQLQAALFQIAQLATADIGEEEFYRSVHDVVGKLLNARNFFIAMLSDDRRMLEFPYFVDDIQRDHPGRPVGRGLSEYVLRHARPLLGDEAHILELVAQGEIEVVNAGPISVCWLGVPLMFGDEAVGLVAVQSYEPSVIYGAAEQDLLGFVASQIANSLSRRHAALLQRQDLVLLEERVAERTLELRREIGERERMQEQLQHEVMHDALTGLPNRGYLRDRLERVLSLLKRDPKRQCALLYLDIDRFKVINDSLGHLAGDSFLKAIAQRLLACVRDPDLVARLAGDEFAILLEDVPSPRTAVRVAQRVLDSLAAPMLVAGKELEPSASIGIAIANGEYALADEVLRDADIALYRAKRLGRKRFELFDASLQKRAVDVLAMEGELRVALHKNQFEPFFQPIMRLSDNVVLGNEALIRWNHPGRGLIGPGEFLQIAEDSGSIEAIDWWMFERSCQLAARPSPGEPYLAINVSPLHFRRVDFCDRLLAMLERTGLPPSRLVLEVTEGSLLDDPEGVREILATLRDQGIGAALDDFGTGYSSLSYLHTFPLRFVKIDRSFVARLDEAGHGNSGAVVTSILALALALGMEAVAEGIETEAQRDILLDMGCRFGQGYLLGRPGPVPPS